MTPTEWQRHKDMWCERCKHNGRRKPCPAIKWLDLDPNDMICSQLIRGDHCTQYEPKPERKTKQSGKGRSRKTTMNEHDWKNVEDRLSALTLKELRPIKSSWFNGSMGGAATKREIVRTMVSQMRHWWRMADGGGRERVQNVLGQLREVEEGR